MASIYPEAQKERKMQSYPVNETKNLGEEENYVKSINIKDLILSFFRVELLD